MSRPVTSAHEHAIQGFANAAVSSEVASQEVIGDEVTREKRRRVLLGSVPLKEMHIGANEQPSLEGTAPVGRGTARIPTRTM